MSRPGVDAQTEAQLARRIVESATDFAIISLRLDGTVTSWNAGAEKLMGWSQAEMVGQDGRIIFTPEDRAVGAPDQEMGVALRDGRAEDERWHLRHDGSRFFGSGTMMPLRDEATGEPIGFLKILLDRTGRHHAEQRLHEAEARFRNIADYAPVMMWVTDPSGYCIYLNQRWYEFTGQTPAEAEGFGWLDATHPDDKARAGEAFQSANAAQASFRLEYRLRRADGMYRWVIDAASPRFGPGGDFLGHVGSVIDIDERREAERALSASEARLAEERTRLMTLIDGLPVGVCFIDAGGRPLLSNPAFRRFLPGQVMPSSSPETAEQWIGHDEKGERLIRERYPGARALRGETVPGVEFLHRAENGRETWTQVSGIPLRDSEGQVRAAILVIVDIDAQKRAQEALQRLNETLEQRVEERTADRDRIWRLSSDVMLVARLDATITAVNPAWTALLGWREEELVGRSFIDLLHPDDVDSTAAETGRLSEGAATLRFENRYRHKDGGYRWLSWTAVPGEGLIHAVGRDVTAEKERAKALASAEEQLRQAQKMEAIGQLTGGIAHDFNNLLTGVLGNLELLEKRLPDEKRRRLAQAATQSAQRGARLIQQLLAFARKQHLSPQPVDLNAAVTGMVEILQRTIGPAIDVQTRLAADLWPALVDVTQIESALLNLAINARDAMPLGGRLTIETCNIGAGASDSPPDLPAGLDAVVLSVGDTGEGMMPEVLARAFEPFYTTKGIGKGSGLGLSQVYGLAQQSGGTARIRSTPGKGTVVDIYLPRTAVPGGATSEERTPESSGGTGATVLVVDDEEEVLEVVTAHVEALGYRAVAARSGPSALEVLARGDAVDVLLVDYAMPGLTGTDVIRTARQAKPDLAVVLMTGYADTLDAETGEVTLLRKPFRTQELGAAILDAMRRLRAGGDVAT